MRRSFAEFDVKQPRGKGCRRCGAERNAGQISLALRQFGPTGTLKKARHVAHHGLSLCEPCAVHVYEAARAAIDREAAPITDMGRHDG